MLPANIESEKAICGLVLNWEFDPNVATPFDVIDEYVGSGASGVCYTVLYEKILRYARGIVAQAQTPGLQTMLAALTTEDRSSIDVMTLSDLQQSVTGYSEPMLRHHMKNHIAPDKRRRELIQQCVTITDTVRKCESLEIDDLLGAHLQVVRGIIDQANAEGAIALGEAMDDAKAAIRDQDESYVTGSTVMKGITTGFSHFDKYTLGLLPGRFYIISGRPACGKTTLAMDMAARQGAQNIPVGMIQMEMSVEQLTERWIFQQAKVNVAKWSTGFRKKTDKEELLLAADILRDSPIWIDCCKGLNIDELAAKARNMVAKFGIQCLYIDNFHLMVARKNERRYSGDTEWMTEASNRMKQLAKELHIPVVLIAHLNRESEKERRMPRLADLRQCGALEQDADFVGILFNDYRFDKDEDVAHPDKMEEFRRVTLQCCKAREGAANAGIFFKFTPALFDFQQGQSPSELAAADTNDEPSTWTAPPITSEMREDMGEADSQMDNYFDTLNGKNT